MALIGKIINQKKQGIIQSSLNGSAVYSADSGASSPNPAPVIQPKLTVGNPDDKYEKEAETIADKVMHMPAQDFVQRKCAHCEEEEKNKIQRKPLIESVTPFIQVKSNSISAVSDTLSQSIESARGKGHTIDGATQSFMSSRFGKDFSDVKIHTDSDAIQMNRELNAKAFTTGRDIYFNEGQYQPGSDSGKHLLAHELTHVVQQGGSSGQIQKQDADKGEFTRLEIVQLNSRDSKDFQVNIVFSKGTISFTGHMMTRGFFLGPGNYTILNAEDESMANYDRESFLLLYLPSHSDYFFINIGKPEDKPKMTYLRKMELWLSKGNKGLMVIKAYGSKEGPEEKKETKEEPKKSTIVDAEPWLLEELIPAVQKVIEGRTSDYKPDKLIGYQSLKIQEQEGKDISMIQAEKENEPKPLRIYVKVKKSSWVDQTDKDKQAYAELVADQVLQKLETSKLTTYVPQWVIDLKQKVDAKIAELKKESPAPSDLPDKISVDPVGDTYYFHLFVQKKAENSDKMLWNSARMTPALDEAYLKDVDAFVAIVREKTAMLQQRSVREPDSDSVPVMNILMMPVPAVIISQNMGNDTSITGAKNKFEMVVKIGSYFGIYNAMSLDLVTKVKQMLPIDLKYQWKVTMLDQNNLDDIMKKTSNEDEKGARQQVFEDFMKPGLDSETRSTRAFEWINYKHILDSASYSEESSTDKEMEFAFPAAKEGIYVVACKVTPHSLQEGDYKKIFPPSYAVMTMRVLNEDALAKESVNEVTDKAKDKEKLLSDPNIPDEDKEDIRTELAQIKKEEGMSQLELTKQTRQQLTDKMEELKKLKKWMIDDKAVNKTTEGNENENPFVIRLQIYDRQNDQHLFRTWKELYGMVGDAAYDRFNLELDFKEEGADKNGLNRYMALVNEQIKGAEKLESEIVKQEGSLRKGSSQRVVATLIQKKTGQTIPLLLLLGQTQDSKEGAYKYRIVDLTFSGTPLYNKIDHEHTGDADADLNKAIKNAFIVYGEDNKYDEGTVYYRIVPDTAMQNVPNKKTVSEWAEEIAMYLALIGAVASIAFTGGASTPAVAAVLAVITIANVALAAFLAYRNLAKRSANDTLEMDTAVALDVVNLIASVVGLSSIGKLAQLGRVAKAAQAAGQLAKAAQVMTKIEMIGKAMLLFDIASMGTTAVIVGAKVVSDVEKINGLDLPQSQKDILLKDVAVNAVIQGAMMAFQTVMMARMHMEAAKTKLEQSKYKNLEERGWIDSDGKITSSAPPALRGVKSPQEINAGSAKPGFDMNEEFGLLFNEAKQKGKELRSTGEGEYDAVINIRNKAGEDHSYKRRKEDGVWCRYSKNPFCFLTDSEIENALRPLDAFIGPTKAASRQAGKGGKGNWPTLTKDIETTMETGASNLRKELGKKWLPPWLYGTKLHKKVADIFRNMKMPGGWTAIIEKPMNEFVKAGIVDNSVAGMTVKQYLKGTPLEKTLMSELPDSILSKKIGQLEPDMVLVAPDGSLVVWDLTPRSQTEHLAKTMLYSHILSAKGGRRVQIGESYYKWQSHIELDTTGQSAFSQNKPATGQISLKDDKVLSLIKRFAGTGKQEGKIPAGMSGGKEVITGNKDIIGQYYDAKSKSMKDTTDFVIHYSDNGLFIEPVKPK